MVNEYKICKKCDAKKLYPDEFVAKNMSTCKKCRNLALKTKRVSKRKPKQSKEEKLRKIKEWQQNNPDKRKMAIEKYHSTHVEQERKYRLDNSDKIVKRVMNYTRKNRKTLNAKLRARRKNPVIKLRHQISTLVRLNIHGTKCGSILKYLPYTIDALKSHIESQFETWMTWNNWGVYRVSSWDDNDSSTWKWQLDHIIPHSQFKYESMEDQEFKECWSLSNLRPLSAKQNLLENNRR